MTASASKNSWVGFSRRPDDFAALSFTETFAQTKRRGGFFRRSVLSGVLPIPASRCARATVAKGRVVRDLLNLPAPVRPPCRGFFMSTRVITRANSLGFAALLRRYISSKLRSMPRLTTLVLIAAQPVAGWRARQGSNLQPPDALRAIIGCGKKRGPEG